MENFFLGILEITVGMSLLILVMFFGLKLIGGKFTAKCRYILWVLVLVRLALPFSMGILPALIEVPIESEPEPVQIQTAAPPAVEYTPAPQMPVTVQPQETVQTPVQLMEMPLISVPEPEPDPVTWDDIAAYIPYVYLAGAAVFLLWNLLSYWIYTTKILRSAREADAVTQKIYEAVCQKKGLHRLPKLLVSPDVNSPAAFGIIRSRIVLPDIGFTENGLAGTLSHEVTHCKRGDLWIKAVALLARSLHWFNPLSHLAAFRCEMEMELSCDEAVLSGCDENTRAAYGEVMLDIIRRCRRNRGALTTHFNPRKSAVKARFTNILYGSGKKRGLWLIAVCLVMCLVAGAIVACRTEGGEADETAEEAQQRETLLAAYEQYQTEYSDLQAQLKRLDNNYADMTASKAELQSKLEALTASRENLYTQLAGMPEDSEEALQLRLAIQEYDEEIKSCQLAISGVDSEITLLESQRQTVQEKLQALADSMNYTEAKMREMDILPETEEKIGQYAAMEAYVTDRMAKKTTAQYYNISSQPKTANVTDTKLTVLEKKGEVAGLAPEGILECWRYKYLLKLDVPTEEVIPVGGQEREDDWFDLEGQNGHTVVALRYPDGTYTILMDEMTGDGLDFTGYRNSYEEAIHDWYVKEYGLGLPLYVEEWGNLITLPEGEHIGNTPVHRFDGDGWGIYIPVQAWYSSTDAPSNDVERENQWLWRSSYNTGSTLTVDVFSHSLEDEYVTAEKQGYTPADSTDRVWELYQDGLHSYYYYYEKPNGGFWRVTIEWTDEGVSNYNVNIVIEPQILQLMAEKFVVFGTGDNAAEESGTMQMAYMGTHIDYPARWYTDQIGLLGTAGGDDLPEGDFMFWLDEYRAYTESGTGRVWTLEAVPLADFAETAGFWKNTQDTDVYTQIFNQASCLLGTDTEYAYVLTLPTDVQFLEKDPVSRENYGLLQAESQAVLENFMNQNGITPNPTCPASEVYTPQRTTAITSYIPDIPLNADNREYLICAASYGKVPAYAHGNTIYAGADGEGYAVLGVASHFKKDGVCSAYHTYRVVSENNTIVSVEETETFTHALIRKKGKPYTGPLAGMYSTQSFSMTNGGRMNRTIYLQENGSMDAAAFLDGTDAGGTYSGTYTYNSTDGTFTAVLTSRIVSNGEITTSEPLHISGKLYEYGGFVHFLCEESQLYDLTSEDPLPLTFVPNHDGSMDTIPRQYDDVFSGDWYHSYTSGGSSAFYYFGLDTETQTLRFYDGAYESEYASLYGGTFTVNPLTYIATAVLRDICTESRDPDLTMQFTLGWSSGGRDGTETLTVTFTACDEGKYAHLAGQTLAFTREPLIPVKLPTLETPLISSMDPDTIYQTFLDTTVAPYMDYISSLEYNDLDGNGIPELLLFDYGMGICEIYTIEGGEVRCLYTGQQGSGHSLLTVYSDDPTALAPPSLGAVDYVFYASATPTEPPAHPWQTWFTPETKQVGSLLYCDYGNTVSRTSQYFHFYSGTDAELGKFLCVTELARFEIEAINSNPELGWECWYQGEKVSKNQYFGYLESCWDTLEQAYGVTYNEENTRHWLDELRKSPNTSYELLADLLDTLKTEDPQAYISRTSNGDGENPAPAWGFYEDDNFPERLAAEFTFEPLSGMEVQEEAGKIILRSVTPGEWVIYGWVNSNYIELVTGGQSYFFRAIYKWPNDLKFGDILNDWFYQAEFNAIPYQSVIPDEGQGFLAAAQTFVESYYNRHLLAFSGSEHAFAYVSCSVRDAENRDGLIERGWIGQNTYTYYVTVIFVPENPYAGRQYYAGNTGLYEGDDPTVPANAYEFQRVGYITLEEDGWHGEIGGTGW